MSYEIACARAKVFRAAVIYEGGQLSGCDGGNDPIALWQSGRADGHHGQHELRDAHSRQVREEQRLHAAEPAAAS